MKSRTELRDAAAKVLDPEEVDKVLSSSFYSPSVRRVSGPAPKNPEKPTHYKVICISMYTDDLMRLDTMVEDLKARGMTKANRSALIRYALAEVNLETVPKGL